MSITPAVSADGTKPAFSLFGTMADQLSNVVDVAEGFANKTADIMKDATDADARINPLTAMIAPGIPMPGLATTFKVAAGYMPNPLEGMTNFFNTVVVDPLKNIAESVDNGINTTIGFAGAMQSADKLVDFMAGQPQFQTLEGRKFIDIARNDPAFAASLHTALKDPSVLAAVINPGKGEDAFDLGELAENLENPMTRKTLTGVLNAVGTDPKLDVKYLKEIAKATKKIDPDNKPVAEDYKKLRELLQQAGVEDERLDYAIDPMKAIGEFFNDPVEFAKKLPAMMNMHGEQAEAFGQLFTAMALPLEMVIGGDTGYRAFFNHYAPMLFNGSNDMFERLSGKRDEDLANEASAKKLADDIHKLPLTNADVDAIAMHAYLPAGSQIVIPSLAALEGDKTNVDFIGPRLPDAFAAANSRPYEDGLPKIDVPAGPVNPDWISEQERIRDAQMATQQKYSAMGLN